MIYEIRTYTLRPGTLPEVIKRFGDNYEHRRKHSELAAFWFTEIGPLNQIIHVWPYENAEERVKVRAATLKDPNWPPPIGEFLVDMNSEIFTPFPDAPQFEPGNHGPIYEMRSYILKAGSIPKMIKIWNGAIGPRAERSPVAAALYTDTGQLNKFVHIWPYSGLDSRAEIRQKAVADGIWPPSGGLDLLVNQENKIMLSAPFSPML